jgi:ElaB/YqjD/DUF883 family membrane-anchored ribosome-binding protein
MDIHNPAQSHDDEAPASIHERASAWVDDLIAEINEVVAFQGKEILRDTDTLRELVQRRLAHVRAEMGDGAADFIYEAMEAIYPDSSFSSDEARGKLGGDSGGIAARVLNALGRELEPSIESFGDLKGEVIAFIDNAHAKMQAVIQAEHDAKALHEGAKSFARRRGLTA